VGPRELSSMPEVSLARRQIHTTLIKRTTVSEISFSCVNSRKQWTTSRGRCGTLFTALLSATNEFDRRKAARSKHVSDVSHVV
jgi:hypothetical protein